MNATFTGPNACVSEKFRVSLLGKLIAAESDESETIEAVGL